MARVRAGLQSTLNLGNLDARRDRGYAPEYVDAIWRMLQAEEPKDLVIATGESHTVREFVENAFSHAGLDWEAHVEIDPEYFRPRRSTTYAETPGRPGGSWDGRRGRSSTSWCV